MEAVSVCRIVSSSPAIAALGSPNGPDHVAAGETQKLARQRCGAVRGPADLRGVVLARVVLLEALAQQLVVVADDEQQIVEVVAMPPAS